jgi:hypothetical protein
MPSLGRVVCSHAAVHHCCFASCLLDAYIGRSSLLECLLYLHVASVTGQLWLLLLQVCFLLAGRRAMPAPSGAGTTTSKHMHGQ